MIVLSEEEFNEHLESGFDNADPDELDEWPNGHRLEKWHSNSTLMRWTDSDGIVSWAATLNHMV